MPLNKKLPRIFLICLLIAVVVFSVLVAASYLPRRVQQDFLGIELLMTGENESEILQAVDIRIDGQIRNRIFAAYPRFDGLIEVSGYGFTMNNPNLTVPFINGFSMGGSMMYPVLERGATRIESLGWLYTNEDFSSFVIHITEWVALGGGTYQGQQSNRVIVAPATDADVAIELLNLHGFSWSDEFGVMRYFERENR